MSNVNKVKLSSEGTSGVPAVIFLLGGPVPKTNVERYQKHLMPPLMHQQLMSVLDDLAKQG